MDIRLGSQVPQVKDLALLKTIQRLRLRAKDADLKRETVGGVRDVAGRVRDENVGVLGVVADVDGDARVEGEVLDILSIGPDTQDLSQRRAKG